MFETHNLSSAEEQDSTNEKKNGLYFNYAQSRNNRSSSEALECEKKRLQVFFLTLKRGNTNIVFTTIREMSHWTELERLKNLTSMQTTAFASAAHEFKNPLNAINASLELLDPVVTEEGGNRPYFIVARNCTNLMLFLVNDILDFAQIEEKSLILNYEQLDIIEVINQCLSVLNHKAIEKGIELTLDCRKIGGDSLIMAIDKNRVS